MTSSGNAVARLASADRILVIGPSGSGKTYLSLLLARLLDRDVIHLDNRFWHPGWVSTPQAQWRESVHRMVEADRWLMDGTYESTLETRISAADTIIVIERSRLACLWGVIRRSIIHRSAPRPDAPPGQPIDRAFLCYIWRYPTQTRPAIDAAISQHGHGKNVIVVRGARGIRTLLAELRAHRGGRALTAPERRADGRQTSDTGRSRKP